MLEVRHASWNDPVTLGMLAEVGVGFCNIDQPRLGASLRSTAEATSDIGYVRLHGAITQSGLQEIGNRTSGTITCTPKPS